MAWEIVWLPRDKKRAGSLALSGGLHTLMGGFLALSGGLLTLMGGFLALSGRLLTLMGGLPWVSCGSP
ncbi:hypothetical protein QT716_01340 [Sporosarcina aquimarina]|uniref:Uncharacterized protein n=1 Tax=Sporosarcina aquimarina TaxID=114975 RepID=A0ABU4FVE3_9BACL|nr:hypothetical protein [Sporosarcina aquimarina]